MLEGTGKPTFTPILNSLRAVDPEESGEILRGEVTKDGVWRLYGDTSLTPNGNGETALARSLARGGAQIVKEAMADKYGRKNVAPVFREVRKQVHDATKRLIDEEMTRGDLNLLQQEYKKQQLEELQKLNDGAPRQTQEAIKSDLAKNWQVATTWGKRDIRWSNGATVSLNSHAYGFYVQEGIIQFDETMRVLTLTRAEDRQPEPHKSLEDLARFIHEHFGAEPGMPKFEHIANNILPYLPGNGDNVPVAQTMMKLSNNNSSFFMDRRIYTLSVRDNGSVGVKGEVHGIYEEDDRGGLIDFTKCEFLHTESFEISGRNLGSAWTPSQAKAYLDSEARSDTIAFAA